MKITGSLQVFVNNDKVAQVAGSGELQIGGEQRETVLGASGPLGHRVTGNLPGAIDFEAVHFSQMDVDALNNLEEATVVVQADTGDRWLLSGAKRVGDPITIGSNGTIAVRIEASRKARPVGG